MINARLNSKKVYEELCTHIPGGVNSPVRSCKGLLPYPMVVESALADCLTDVDGNNYIDFCGSWGALIYGHAHPKILDAVQKRLSKGTTFGITTEIEGQLARKVSELMPSIEKIRFVSSGTEATMSAVRLARGYTKRDLIVKFSGNYHGHADFFLVQAGSGVTQLPHASSAGIPQDTIKNTISLPYNDISACRAFLQDPKWCTQIAAIILEPVAGNLGVVPAKKEFLQMLREESKKIGALLIFDEVISGFRVALGGAQELYGIKPDLTCVGKILGGGFPAAAFGGREEIMNHLAPLGSIYQAGTLSGNPIAMEAGLQTLSLLEQNVGTYESLVQKTEMLIEPIKEVIAKNQFQACIQSVGSMFTLFFGRTSVENFEEAQQLDEELFKEFFQYLFSHGVYIPPAQHEAWFISLVHSEKNIIKTRDLILDFFNQVLPNRSQKVVAHQKEDQIAVMLSSSQ